MLDVYALPIQHLPSVSPFLSMLKFSFDSYSSLPVWLTLTPGLEVDSDWPNPGRAILSPLT